MNKKTKLKSTTDLAFGVLNKPAVVGSRFVPNILPKLKFGSTITIGRETATFIASGVFWNFEGSDRFDIDTSLIDCDAALTANFGISFSYNRSKDDKTYTLFVTGVHIATLHHSHDDNDALQMRIEDFEPFEIKTAQNPQMLSIGSEGSRVVEKTKNGVVTYRREDYGSDCK